MQQKKTGQIDLGELPELTEHQAKFVEEYLKGKSATEAYRAAYDCSNSSNKTVWTEASRARHHPAIALWISAARQAGMGSPKINLDQHITRLERLSELCIMSGNMGAAVQAEQLIGKASGHYTERLDITSGDPMDALKQIAELSPALAEELAKQHGIETKH